MSLNLISKCYEDEEEEEEGEEVRRRKRRNYKDKLFRERELGRKRNEEERGRIDRSQELKELSVEGLRLEGKGEEEKGEKEEDKVDGGGGCGSGFVKIKVNLETGAWGFEKAEENEEGAIKLEEEKGGGKEQEPKEERGREVRVDYNCDSAFILNASKESGEKSFAPSSSSSSDDEGEEKYLLYSRNRGNYESEVDRGEEEEKLEDAKEQVAVKMEEEEEEKVQNVIDFEIVEEISSSDDDDDDDGKGEGEEIRRTETEEDLVEAVKEEVIENDVEKDHNPPFLQRFDEDPLLINEITKLPLETRTDDNNLSSEGSTCPELDLCGVIEAEEVSQSQSQSVPVEVDVEKDEKIDSSAPPANDNHKRIDNLVDDDKKDTDNHFEKEIMEYVDKLLEEKIDEIYKLKKTDNDQIEESSRPATPSPTNQRSVDNPMEEEEEKEEEELTEAEHFTNNSLENVDDNKEISPAPSPSKSVELTPICAIFNFKPSRPPPPEIIEAPEAPFEETKALQAKDSLEVDTTYENLIKSSSLISPQSAETTAAAIILPISFLPKNEVPKAAKICDGTFTKPCPDDYLFICPFCFQNFRGRPAMIEHLNSHSKDIPCKTETEPLSVSPPSPPQSSLSSCTLSQSRRDSLRCRICNKVLSSQIKLKNHMTIHSEKAPFSCTYCHKGFFSPYSLRRHNKSKHRNKRKAESRQTNGVSTTDYEPAYKELLKKLKPCSVSLVRCDHLVEKGKQSKISTSDSASDNLLPSEKKSDKDEEEFDDEDEISDLDDDDDDGPLASEIWICCKVKCGVEVFVCMKCRRSFSHWDNAVKHLRTHENDKKKPFKCKFCKRRFSFNTNLQRHMKNSCSNSPRKTFIRM